jgi:alkaline phosphatase D
MLIDRRLLMKGAALGAGALAIPAWAQAVVEARGFTHDVASGEPGADRVLLWTRYVPATGQSARLRWQVARDAGFGTIVARGETEASAGRDWCVKPVVDRLAAGSWYFYRFIDEDGAASPVGRTRTLPDGPLDRFTLGVFTCANLPFGYFNAYGHAAGRRDIDLLLHLGDYLYEYPRGTYPALAQAVPGRIIDPAHETLALADYRLRHAAYRLDPDLQRLHRQFPMVVMWDDHESANDSWQGGAQNHDPASEGDWQVRKAAAKQAFREWLPVSDEDWAVYRIGDLADLFRLDTRLHGRSQQLNLTTFLRGKEDTDRALAEFRDGPWHDPARTLLGQDQEQWLYAALRSSVAAGAKWQVLGQQVIAGSMSLTPEMAALVSQPDDAARARMQTGLAAARAGLPSNMDAWDGYPAARDRLLAAALEAEAQLIVLAGDSHNAWAFDLDRDGTPAGAEFAVHSVTSPGYEARVPGDAAAFARTAVAGNRQLRWADTSRRGYLTLELTPEQVTGQWHFLETVREPSLALSGMHGMSVARGRNRFAS